MKSINGKNRGVYKLRKKLLIIFIIIFIVAGSFRVYRYFEHKQNLAARDDFGNLYAEMVDEYQYKEGIPGDTQGIFGNIKIPEIDLEYPVLDETTKENLDISITKYAGPELHENGNLVLSGHNYRDGSIFGRLDEVAVGDDVIISDLKGEDINYEISETFVVDGTDLSIIDKGDENDEYLTLYTCLRTDNTKRFVVFAKKTE